MCITPVKLPDGNVAACRKCKRCRDNRVKDLVGRCILEGESAVATTSVTLTYGPDDRGNADHWRARFLALNDFRKYVKLMRWHGYPVRYLAAGEYGTMKGRAHFHAVLFWQDRVPAFEAGELLNGEVMKAGEPYPVGKRFMQRFWPHGWSHWEPGDYKSIKYVAKYVLKDEKDKRAMSSLSYSRYPILGAAAIELLARRYVEQGLVPNVPNYWFRDVLKRSGPDKGRPIEFRLEGRSLELFAECFEREWKTRCGSQPPRAAAASRDHQGGSAVKGLDRDWLVDFGDKHHRKSKAEILAWTPDVSRQKAVARPWKQPPDGAAVAYSVAGKCYYYDTRDGVRMFWSFDSEGNRQWRNDLVSEAEGLRRRAQAERERERDALRKNSSSLYRGSRDGLPMS